MSRLPGESWESKQAHHVIHQPVSVVSQCGAGVWLNGASRKSTLICISVDLREAVAHQRRVSDDALYKSTATLLLLYRRTDTETD